MADEVRRLTIGEVARKAGMCAARIRCNESRGVLPPPGRVSGMRRYSPDVVRRLAIVDVVERVGCTLGEIRERFAGDRGPAHQRLRRLAERKLPDIDEPIQRPNAVRGWLEMTGTGECGSLGVGSLFDDRVLGLNARTASARSPSVPLIAPSR